MNVMNEQIRIQEAGGDFETLFKLNPAPMLVSHVQTLKLLAVNQAALELYGLEHGTMLRMSLQDLRHPDEIARFKDAFENLPDNGLRESSWRHQHWSGETLFLECATRAVMFEGQPAALSVLRDVTIERRAVRTMEASARRFRDLFQHTLGFICTHDLDGVLLSVNPAASKSLGYSVGELLGTSLRDLISENWRDKFPGYLQRLRDNGNDRGLLTLCHRDGSLRVWQYHNSLFEDADGTMSVMASAQDITDLRAAEEAARRSERQIRMITDALPLRVGYVDPQMRFVFVNGLYERLYGRHRDHIVGKHLSEVVDSETLAARMPYLERALNGQAQHFEVERNSPRGRQCDEITFLPDFAVDGSTVLGIYVIGQDITDQKQQEQRLVELAQRDSLTGLLNRSGTMDRLRNALNRSRDQSSSLAVLYMDLDGFKQVNDLYGHGVGDWVLQTAARRLENTARTSDGLGRLGGDEFVLIMEGVRDTKPVVQMAQTIVDSLAQAFVLPDTTDASPIKIGVSMGIAMANSAHEDAATLLKRADGALYDAKRNGRGTWRMAEP